MNTKQFKAYISGTGESQPFDYAYGKTSKTAISAVKRKNSPDWGDCIIWCVYLHDDGQEEKITNNFPGA